MGGSRLAPCAKPLPGYVIGYGEGEEGKIDDRGCGWLGGGSRLAAKDGDKFSEREKVGWMHKKVEDNLGDGAGGGNIWGGGGEITLGDMI